MNTPRLSILIFLLALLPATLLHAANDPDYDKGKAAYKNKDYQVTFTLFAAVVERHPDVAKYHYNYGLAARKLKKPEIAYKAFTRALELDPEISFTKKPDDFHAKLKEMKALISHDDVMYVFQQGEDAYKSGNYSDAYDYYDRAAKIEPGNARFHYTKGLAARKIKRYSEAYHSLLKAQSLDPDLTFTGDRDSFLKKLEEMRQKAGATSETDEKLLTDSDFAENESSQFENSTPRKSKRSRYLLIGGVIAGILLLIFLATRKKKQYHKTTYSNDQPVEPYDDYDSKNIHNSGVGGGSEIGIKPDTTRKSNNTKPTYYNRS